MARVAASIAAGVVCGGGRGGGADVTTVGTDTRVLHSVCSLLGSWDVTVEMWFVGVCVWVFVSIVDVRVGWEMVWETACETEATVLTTAVCVSDATEDTWTWSCCGCCREEGAGGGVVYSHETGTNGCC